MDNSQFYLWLPSNSSMDIFPNNTLTEYQVFLPQKITLSGDWEVALTEIQYPHTWNNMHSKDKWNRFYLQKDLAVNYFDLPAGHYTSADSLVKKLNRVLKGSPHEKKVWFTYEKLTRKITVHLEDGLKVFFGEMGTLLGFDTKKRYDQTTTAQSEVDLNLGFHNLYVYCDIVETQVVGHAQVPLLRVVPVEGKDGKTVTKTFLDPQYLPVSRKEFETIEVNIKRDNGEIVPFESGRVLITLHFRRANPLLN